MRFIRNILFSLPLLFVTPALAAECVAPSQELRDAAKVKPVVNVAIDGDSTYHEVWQYVADHYYNSAWLQERHFDALNTSMTELSRTPSACTLL